MTAIYLRRQPRRNGAERFHTSRYVVPWDAGVGYIRRSAEMVVFAWAGEGRAA